MTSPFRKIAAPLLLLLGVQLWLVLGRGQWGNLPPPVVWVTVLALSLAPPVNRRLAALLDRVAQPSPRARLITTFLVAFVAGAYLYLAAVGQGRPLFLKVLDENSYAIQARMLAAGRLWTAAHPAAESFDSPYVLVRPVYASMYFPGAALMLVPGVWLGLPWWATPLVAFALAVGVLYRVASELVDGVAGLLAALMLLSLSMFRELAFRLYSQVPMLLLALLLAWAWLAWRNDRRPWRAAVIGMLAGWMLIVRPLDALVFLAPVAAAMAFDLRKFDRRTLVALAAAAAPFLALQLVANRGVTGSWLTTPHAFYAQRDYPGVTLGFHEPRPSDALVTRTPQKRVLYEQSALDIARHRPDRLAAELTERRLPRLLLVTLPNNLFVILLPFGAVALLRERRRRGRAWVVASPLFLFILAYTLYLYFLAHYLVVVAPAMILLVVLAVRELPEVWPRARNATAVLLTLATVVLCVYALPVLDRDAYDDLPHEDLAAINDLLATLPHRPAIVLFRWQSGVDPHREPVYNVDTLRIDDADVIRAHDLPGEANRTLLGYYASRQPQRHVYRVVRAPGGGPPTLTYLGPVTAVGRAADSPL